MRKTFYTLGVTVLFLAVFDLIVAVTLRWAEENGKIGSLVRYFEYGRSVPGKLAKWEEHPNTPGNLFDVAWPSEILAASQTAFEAEDQSQGPVLRSYGMSFVNNIIREAQKMDPHLSWDSHGGPGAPPNFTYAVYLDDHDARRSGDIAVLGILSSSVAGMAALSNRTWVFEQPAPFTYPVFWPEVGTGLRRVNPLVTSSEEQRNLRGNKQHAWDAQLREQDAFYSVKAFGAPWLDHSPFARLTRRSIVTGQIAQQTATILDGAYPYQEVLKRMVADFAHSARTDGVRPLVMLIQSRDPSDPNLLEILKPVLVEENIRYFATAEHFDPRDASGFMGDGHYLPHVDKMFAQKLIALLNTF